MQPASWDLDSREDSLEPQALSRKIALSQQLPDCCSRALKASIALKVLEQWLLTLEQGVVCLAKAASVAIRCHPDARQLLLAFYQSSMQRQRQCPDDDITSRMPSHALLLASMWKLMLHCSALEDGKAWSGAQTTHVATRVASHGEVMLGMRVLGNRTSKDISPTIDALRGWGRGRTLMQVRRPLGATS